MAANSATPAPTASAHEEAKNAWQYTRKERQNLTRQINKARENTSGTDLSQFDRIDESITRLRLNCVSVIFIDFEYALRENVEELLWQSHVDVNNQFRRTLDRLRPENRPVEKRKVEAKQGHFLRISQKFYKGFITQFSRCYKIPGLLRVAKEIDAEGTTDNSVSPSPEVAEKVLSSVHMTLIRLGDLGRYRVDAKSNKSYGSALVCYSLAHDLVPDSGYAFHQMAIINVKEENHLEIVYNFYRSLAVKEPHPAAKENLEKKFDGLLSSKATKKSKTAPTPSEALILWFVKLHAVFYKGKPLDDNHSALEREVMHRLSIAVKDPTFGVLMLRMALINISASYIAFTKHNESPSEQTANFYKYTLHFNSRFIHQICEAIGNDAREASMKPPAEYQNGDDSKASITEALLPVLRIYSMWIASQWSELFTSTSSPSNVVPHMTRSLANAMTIFCAEIHDAGTEGLSGSPYLLPEDREIRGLVPLREDHVPKAAQGYALDDGTLKPYMSGPERWPTFREMAGRKLDILRCAYYLSGQHAVPLKISQKGEEISFHHQDDLQSVATPKARMAEPTAAVSPRRNGTDSVTTPPRATAQANVQPATAAHRPQQHLAPASAYQAQEMEQTHATVVDMLSPFLDSPPTNAERTRQSPGEPSYGMHSNTAHELAQELLQSFEGNQESAPYYASVSPGNIAASPYGLYFNPASPKAQNSMATPQPAQKEPIGSHRRNNSSRSIPATPGREVFDQQPRMITPTRQPKVPTPGAVGFTAGTPNGGKSRSPRRSAPSQWPQNSQVSAEPRVRGTEQSMPPPASNPFSSGTSAFSNMSSVYQGTPVNGLQYDLPARGNGPQQQATQSPSSAYPMYGQRGYSGTPNGVTQQPNPGYPRYGGLGNPSLQGTPQSPASPWAMYGNNSVNSYSQAANGQPSASRSYRGNTHNSTSSYDARIFEAAMRGNK